MAASGATGSPKVADTLLSRMRLFTNEGKRSDMAAYEKVHMNVSPTATSPTAYLVDRPVVPVPDDITGNDGKWCCVFSLLFFAAGILAALMLYDFHTVTSPRAASSSSSSSIPAVRTEIVFDCDADFSQWEKGWSDAKKRFCCKTEKRGCEEEHVVPYHCQSEDQDSWPLSKQNYCCVNHKVGCLQYDCAAGLQFATTGWSQPKQEFCCKRFKEGCPFDCQADLAHAAAAWSDNQKSWCCKNENRGCDAMPESKQPGNCSMDCQHDGSTHTCADRIAYASKHTYAGHADACQRAHKLIQSECTSCSACTLEAANCTALLSEAGSAYEWHDCKRELTWNATSLKKRSWCCAHQGLGCHEGERPTKIAAGMKWSSSKVNGTTIWKQVKDTEHVAHI